MAPFDQRIIEEVRSRSDIVEVISDYVRLKQAGGSYVGLCPFHTERTPSFTVSPEKQLFYCFGCQEGGDVFKFLMKISNISFVEAVRVLAERAGIGLPRTKGGGGREPELRSLLYRANELAMEFFAEMLYRSKEGEVARNYLKRRGLGAEIARRFSLGYAPSKWDGLLGFLRANGIPVELQLKAGLVIRRKSGSGFYDRFRNRVMFPIFDLQGRVVAFGGRVLDDSAPKYLNSPETEIFSKGNNLYALDKAKERIRAEGAAIMVEGYMDVIALHQYGFEAAIASLGTAFTREQARLLARFTPLVMVAYDADLAGSKATLRGIEILDSSGLEVRVITLPEGYDPDSLVRSQGPDVFRQALEGSLPFTDYRIELALARYDLSSVEGRVKASREIVGILAGLRGAVEREEYARLAAGRLGVSPESLLADLERRFLRRGRAFLRREYNPNKDKIGDDGHTNPKGSASRSRAHMEAERGLIRLMMADQRVAQHVRHELAPEDFVSPDHRALAAAILDVVEGNSDEEAPEGVIKPEAILARLGRGEFDKVMAGILMEEQPTPEHDRMRLVADYVKVIKEYHLRERIRGLATEVRALEEKGELSRAKELLAELGRLMAQLSREFTPFQGPGSFQ